MEIRGFTQELERRVEERTEDLRQALGQLTDERDRVETLFRITSELSASLDLDAYSTALLTLLSSAIGTPRGSILLVDQETESLNSSCSDWTHGGHGAAQPPAGRRDQCIDGANGLAGWVIQ